MKRNPKLVDIIGIDQIRDQIVLPCIVDLLAVHQVEENLLLLVVVELLAFHQVDEYFIGIEVDRSVRIGYYGHFCRRLREFPLMTT